MIAPTWGGWDAGIRDDPFPTFADARRRCPVQQVRLADGHDAWVVVGYKAARRALAAKAMSKDMVAALAADPDVVAEGLPGPEFAHHMLSMDAPDHSRLRRLVAHAFVPGRVKAMRPAIEAHAHALLDDLALKGPSAVVDLRLGFAHRLPFTVIGELLGVDVERRAALQDAFETLLQPWPWPPPAEAVAASDAVTSTLRELLADAVVDPDGNLVAVLADGVSREDISQAEALSSMFQLVVAGHDTTASLIGNGVVALIDHPEQLQLLAHDPELIPAAIDELLRFTAAVPHATFRVATEPVDLDGVTVPAGAQILVCLGASNRDPALVDNPDTLDVYRRSRRHLAFGHGPHACLGAPLARLEADVAFRALLGRFPDLQLGVPRNDLAWSHGDGLVLRGLAELPVILGNDRGAAT